MNYLQKLKAQQAEKLSMGSPLKTTNHSPIRPLDDKRPLHRGRTYRKVKTGSSVGYGLEEQDDSCSYRSRGGESLASSITY